MQNQETTIYSYTDPSLFLRDQWLLKKERNPSFSVRAWAKSLEIKSHSQLHQMLYGKRTIPKKYLHNIVENLKLNKDESEYFETLIDIQKAKDHSEKNFYLEKIKDHKKTKEVFHEIEEFNLIQNPVHGFILEIFAQDRTELSAMRIKELLWFDYSLTQIKRAMDVLITLNLAQEISPGIYKKVYKTSYTQSDIPCEAVKKYHKHLCDIAKDSIDKQDVLEREFNAMTFNMNKKDLADAKEMLRDFRERFVQRFETRLGSGDKTYHINLQLFAVSKDI